MIQRGEGNIHIRKICRSYLGILLRMMIFVECIFCLYMMLLHLSGHYEITIEAGRPGDVFCITDMASKAYGNGLYIGFVLINFLYAVLNFIQIILGLSQLIPNRGDSVWDFRKHGVRHGVGAFGAASYILMLLLYRPSSVKAASVYFDTYPGSHLRLFPQKYVWIALVVFGILTLIDIFIRKVTDKSR